MSQTATMTREPAWTLIILAGVLAILASGLMLQMQFGGARTSGKFATVSRYESAASSTHTVIAEKTSAPQAAVESVTSEGHPASEVVLTIKPLSPPAGQPEWLVAPCSALRAGELQRQWARHLGLPVEVRNQLGQVFRLVPPGVYDRGANPEAISSLLDKAPPGDEHWKNCLKSSTPVHRVLISKPFYLAVNEVTQSEYAAIIGRNPSWYATNGPEPFYVSQVKGLNTARHPVEGVSWEDAQHFARQLAANKLGQLNWAGKPATKPTNGPLPAYRLPTDAEWEHACRGGTASLFSFGDTEPTVAGWFGELNGNRTWPVGRGERNSLGLYGLHFGVWEWVEDQWSVAEFGQYREWPVRDPLFSSSTSLPRVVRGGMWPDRRTRSFDRYAYDANFQTFFVGFRLALSVPEKQP